MTFEEKLQQLKLVICDVDGVLTDGSLHYDAHGEALKTFHVRDGLGMKMLMDAGIQVAILSGRDSAILRKRIDDLKIPLFFLGKLEKESACFELMRLAGVKPEETAYIGDDSVDLPAFAVCGVAFAVNDAPDYVQSQADFVLKLSGGRGAVREMSDMILKAQGKDAVYRSAQGFLASVKNMGQ